MEEDLKALREAPQFDVLLAKKPVLSFSLGGFIYHLHLTDNNNKQQLDKWYYGFSPEANDQPIHIAYSCQADLDPLHFNRFLNDSSKYRNVQVVTEHHLLAPDELAVFRWDFRALLNKRTRLCRVFLINQSAASIDAIARIAGALLYAEKDSFLVHGSSILYQGKGYLFTGVSGSGKSTIAELSGALVLNDEISLLQFKGDTVYVQGTPFYGDLKRGENVSAPLAGLFLLQQDSSTFIEELDPLRQNLFLLRNVVFFQADLASFDQIHSLLSRVLVNIPLRKLHFQRDNGFLEVL
ncbi:MAG: hypothetical protein V2B20_15350 [Pseudomonadota bacterium]